MSRTYKFIAQISQNVASFETYPILDESLKQVVGGFTVMSGDSVSGFVSGQGYDTALAVSSESPFWFTVVSPTDGSLYGIVSDTQITHVSQKIKLALPS